jgi:hypothetical protein
MFRPGQSGNPKGRPPGKLLLPEVQKAIDANRNAVKVLILEKLQPNVGEWIDSIIAEGTGAGDIVRFKLLLELAMGKMVDDPPEFPVSEEEKLLVLEYRKLKEEYDGRAGTVRTIAVRLGIPTEEDPPQSSD